MRIKLHSSVGLITNSSSVVYTHQNSIHETKELLKSIFKLFGVNEDVDDVFSFGVFYDLDIYNLGDSEERAASLIRQYLRGEISRPKWLEDATTEGCWNYGCSSYLWIVNKDKKYDDLSMKIRNLVSSVKPILIED